MSLARTLGQWFRPDGVRAGLVTHGVRAALALHESSTLAAPHDGSIRVLRLDELLEGHAPLIGRIRVAYGGEEGSFERQLAPSIRRFAAFVHLLPATPDAHFRYPGGLLRCGLEVGLYALQAADAQIFSKGGTVEARRAAAPRWRAAAFVAGLCSEAYRPVFAATVHCDIGGPWNPLLMPLLDWLERRRCERYIVRWPERCAVPRAATLAVLPQILAPTLVAFLAEPDRAVLDHVLSAIAAPADVGRNTIGSIVEQTLARVLVRDLRLAPAPDAAPTTTAPSSSVSGDEPASVDVTPPGNKAALPSVSEPRMSGAPGDSPATVEAGAPTAPAREAGGGHGVPVADAAPKPPQAPRRTLAIPSTLHPAVAEALALLLAAPTGVGIDVSPRGVFVPLALFAQRGLDTGLVVGALHDARLLVLQGSRKVWRARGRDPDVPGVMLNARLLASP